MNTNTGNIVQEAETVATSALAAASKTPFKTAFLITLGIGAAHVVMALLFFGGAAAVITTLIYAITR